MNSKKRKIKSEYGVEFKLLGEWYPCNKPGLGFGSYGDAMRAGKTMRKLDGFPHRIVQYMYEGEKKELIKNIRRVP